MERGTGPTGPGGSTDPGSDPGLPPRPSLPNIPTLSGGDWPAQAADAIVDAVGKVRDRTTVPIMKLARATVYGVFIGTFFVVLCTLLIIGLVRLLDEILPSGVWLPYLILGVVVTGLGWLLFRKRTEAAAAVGNDRSR